ncbi:branched-chain amino acid ABC transporter permease [Sinorhizobium sp. BJ1]|uniref:branched-chain amino acid ABC transporter permease n=1 Tax=Sinorhizobium sp. BJ1 TaxID=2035455 RepID=UPI000BE9317A|nr:branched-chain amino acid ABC transporter permease [Sinorhizobium sp. BJ1]PDT80830.1 branched-chain amino acid ABC transporter permease [Sinorhizobium sp. BJ1]
MSTLLQYAVDAVGLGSLFSLVALGVALILGIMRLINFGHGELIMASAFGIVFGSTFGFWGAAAAALIVPLVLALLMEFLAFRPVRNADDSTMLITSLALSFFLQNAAIVFLGAEPRSVDLSGVFGGYFSVGDLRVMKLDVFTIVISSLLLGITVALLQGTKIGLSMRAAAEDVRTARLMGIKANRVVAVAFALSGLLAGFVALAVVARSGSVHPQMGLSVVIVGFVATIIGGRGSLWGSVLAGFLIGLVMSVLQTVLPSSIKPFRDVLVYLLVIGVLVFRPQGLFSNKKYGPREA